jgi:hypothetical protein
MCAKHIIMQTFFRRVVRFFFELGAMLLTGYLAYFFETKSEFHYKLLFCISVIICSPFLAVKMTQFFGVNNPWRMKKYEISCLKNHRDSDFENIISKLPFLKTYFD